MKPFIIAPKTDATKTQTEQPNVAIMKIGLGVEV
jgi:hypothetical protein